MSNCQKWFVTNAVSVGTKFPSGSNCSSTSQNVELTLSILGSIVFLSIGTIIDACFVLFCLNRPNKKKIEFWSNKIISGKQWEERAREREKWGLFPNPIGSVVEFSTEHTNRIIPHFQVISSSLFWNDRKNTRMLSGVIKSIWNSQLIWTILGFFFSK